MNAWDLLTPEIEDKLMDGWNVCVIGGRTLYDAAYLTRNHQVRLARLATDPLRQINRYISWKTQVELVKVK